MRRVLSVFKKRSKRSQAARFNAQIDVPARVYAVGDIHGRRDLLERLTQQIVADCGDRDATIIFMGDYIDRGEQAREAIDFLIEFGGATTAKTVFLMGNHEQMLLRFLRDPGNGAGWLRYGGLQTLMSYGVRYSGSLRDADEARRLRDDLAVALGPHLAFIEGLRASYQTGNLFCAHAGADPSRPIEEQEIGALLWGAEHFLTTARSDGIWVAHGHFVMDQPSAQDGRIALDTGAYFSHRLTAARIVDGVVTFLET